MLRFRVAVFGAELVRFGADFVRHRVIGEPGDFVESLANFGEPNRELLRIGHGYRHLYGTVPESCARSRMPSTISDLRYQFPPCGLRRSRLAPILRPRLLDVTRAAQGLQVRRIPRVTAALKRAHVVDLDAPGPPAPPAPPAVPVEHGAAHPRPSARVQPPMMSAHAIDLASRNLTVISMMQDDELKRRLEQWPMMGTPTLVVVGSAPKQQRINLYVEAGDLEKNKGQKTQVGIQLNREQAESLIQDLSGAVDDLTRGVQ